MGSAGKLIQQLVVGCFEIRQSAWSIQCFHLTELGQDHRSAHSIQLVAPIPEVQVTPLLIDHISFPGHRTKAGPFPGKTCRQQRLQFTRSLLTHKVFLTYKHDNIFFFQLEVALFEGRNRQPVL
ncbi:hypothetical protein [Cyclobacterium sp.]|uniref:hypothetical protein n=1 Tax=Cyclobacterium sp. TaxID=1966343 RepID=UPI0025BEE626|nr:hypothetical protein [Cyclobacterium sp.]